MVTISYSCKPETYRKLVTIKEALESERMESVSMSGIIERLLNMGFAYREILRLEAEKTGKLKKDEIEKVKKIW